MSYTTKPPIVKGKDGLPHCGWCLNDTTLCLYHAYQIKAALGSLTSSTTMQRAETDLRYIIAKRPRGQGVEADA